MSVHSVNTEGLQRLQSLISGAHWLKKEPSQKSSGRIELSIWFLLLRQHSSFNAMPIVNSSKRC
jgi:hypothetical protein